MVQTNRRLITSSYVFFYYEAIDLCSIWLEGVSSDLSLALTYTGRTGCVSMVHRKNRKIVRDVEKILQLVVVLAKQHSYSDLQEV